MFFLANTFLEKYSKKEDLKDIIIAFENMTNNWISSYGEENSIEIKSEEHPYNSHYKYFLDSVFPCKMNYYRDTKAQATKEAIKFAEENNINLTIIEPVWVYGENEFSSGFYEYIKSVKGKTPFFLGSSKNKFHVVYAKDLARAYFEKGEFEKKYYVSQMTKMPSEVEVKIVESVFNELAKAGIPDFIPKEWSNRFLEHLRAEGKEGLVNSLNTTPTLLKHFI
jgi:nucleoside-diphosphate-sugar epimerase